jgi:hypothetical protein
VTDSGNPKSLPCDMTLGWEAPSKILGPRIWDRTPTMRAALNDMGLSKSGGGPPDKHRPPRTPGAWVENTTMLVSLRRQGSRDFRESPPRCPRTFEPRWCCSPDAPAGPNKTSPDADPNRTRQMSPGWSSSPRCPTDSTAFKSPTPTVCLGNLSHGAVVLETMWASAPSGRLHR